LIGSFAPYSFSTATSAENGLCTTSPSKKRLRHHWRSLCSKKPTVCFFVARNLRSSTAKQSKTAVFSRKAKTSGVSTKCIFAFDSPPFSRTHAYALRAGFCFFLHLAQDPQQQKAAENCRQEIDTDKIDPDSVESKRPKCPQHQNRERKSDRNRH